MTKFGKYSHQFGGIMLAASHMRLELADGDVAEGPARTPATTLDKNLLQGAA